MKVKICGITNYEDARLALDQGVDALGFNFFPSSSRYIRPRDASAIIRRLPPFAVSVGLFINVPEVKDVVEIAQSAGVHVIQLQGDESPAYCQKLADWPVIKAIRIGERGIPDNLADYSVQSFLLDAKDEVLFGGTGKSFDWRLTQGIQFPCPIILAGGLRPDNVREAIRIVRPYAVDVCSGVESRPGKKDPGKLIDFMNEVRNVF
jgi:phosphoribosylanthranilate isomerase